MEWWEICGLILVGIVILILILNQLDKARYDIERLKAKRNTHRLIKVMLQEPGLRLKAAEALGQLGDVSAVGPLISASEDPNSTVQKTLIEALQNLGAPAIEGLVDSLKQGRHRKFATEALGKMGAPAVEPLVALLGDSKTRHDATEVLVLIGAPAVGPVSQLLTNSEWSTRDSASRILGRIGIPAVSALIEALKSDVARADAAEALGKTGSQDAIEPLTALLKESDSGTRSAAAEALKALNWQPGDDEPGMAYRIALKQWDQCIEIGGAAVEPLMTALKDTDAEVRAGAAATLGKLADTRAVEPLMDMLKDHDGTVREAVVEALSKFGEARAVEPLIDLLTSQTGAVRQAAASVLVSLYRGTTLNEEQRARILAQQAVITERHQDDAQASHTDEKTLNIEDTPGHTDAFEHGDRGIGLDFPL